MSEASEPVTEYGEVLERQRLTINAIEKALNDMHQRLAITSGEALTALASVSFRIALAQVKVYYEIKEPAPEDVPA